MAQYVLSILALKLVKSRIPDPSYDVHWSTSVFFSSRPGPPAPSRSSYRRHGNRFQVWPSTALPTSQIWQNHLWRHLMLPHSRDTIGGGWTKEHRLLVVQHKSSASRYQCSIMWTQMDIFSTSPLSYPVPLALLQLLFCVTNNINNSCICFRFCVSVDRNPLFS